MLLKLNKKNIQFQNSVLVKNEPLQILYFDTTTNTVKIWVLLEIE